MRMPLLFPTLLALGLGACATGPAPIRGEFSAQSPDKVREQGSANASVRWGGSLIAVEPDPTRTCFVVLSRPLSGGGKPIIKRETTDGRFIACRGGFYDPALFAEGRDVTFTGRVEGFEERQIGAFSYRYPKLAADVVYLWPEPANVPDPRYAFPYRSPAFGPWWGYRPFW
jgi:outer membrane lipoprotein